MYNSATFPGTTYTRELDRSTNFFLTQNHTFTSSHVSKKHKGETNEKAAKIFTLNDNSLISDHIGRMRSKSKNAGATATSTGP